MKRLVTSFAAAGAFAAAIVGCNAILGNEEGKPYTDASVGPGGEDATSSSDAGPADAGGDATYADVTVDAALQCDPGEVACTSFRACVKVTDPNFGCGNPGCIACSANNASAVACEGSDAGPRCKPTCNPGFKNCNADPSDGCEADLTLPTSCGDCTRVCSGAASLCAAATDGGFDCVATCPGGQTKCGSQCVDLQSDPQNCNACGTVCPSAPGTNAVPTCTAGKCGTKCDSTAHSCVGSDICYTNGDVNHCGSGCTDCVAAAPKNASASCQDGQCHFECNAGWGDCNNDLSSGAKGDGCEVDLWTDSKNCGKCTNACAAIQINLATPYLLGSTYCCNGTCVPGTQLCTIREH